MKESAKKTWETKMTKTNFWILSDIFGIFCALSCPGCENATDFQEFKSGI